MSTLMRQVESGLVSTVSIAAGACAYRLHNGQIYRAQLLPGETRSLVKLMHAHRVEFRALGPAAWKSAVVLLLPFAYLGVCGWLLFRLTSDLGGGQVELPDAAAPTNDSARVTFEDVGGMPAAKAQLQEVVDFFHSPERWARLGARRPRGVLLTGERSPSAALLEGSPAALRSSPSAALPPRSLLPSSSPAPLQLLPSSSPAPALATVSPPQLSPPPPRLSSNLSPSRRRGPRSGRVRHPRLTPPHASSRRLTLPRLPHASSRRLTPPHASSRRLTPPHASSRRLALPRRRPARHGQDAPRQGSGRLGGCALPRVRGFRVRRGLRRARRAARARRLRGGGAPGAVRGSHPSARSTRDRAR